MLELQQSRTVDESFLDEQETLTVKEINGKRSSADDADFADCKGKGVETRRMFQRWK